MSVWAAGKAPEARTAAPPTLMGKRGKILALVVLKPNRVISSGLKRPKESNRSLIKALRTPGIASAPGGQVQSFSVAETCTSTLRASSAQTFLGTPLASEISQMGEI